jgi:hypothetical protein
MNPWTNHGTKILGAIITLLGALSALSPDTLTQIAGPMGPGIAVAAGGILTVLRGFMNTAAATTTAPPQAKSHWAVAIMAMVLISVMSAVGSLTACSSLGVTAPKGFDQQLAVAYTTHTAVLQALATATTAGSISSAEAVQVNTQAQSARALLDAARAAEATNPAGAQTNLTLALTGLTALQGYLNAHSGGH